MKVFPVVSLKKGTIKITNRYVCLHIYIYVHVFFGQGLINLMDMSNLLCLLVARSFQSSICVVFLSYWRDLSKHVVLDLMSSSFLFVFFVLL